MPSEDHPHRSPLQEPDEILIPGVTDQQPKKEAVKMQIDDGMMEEDFGKTSGSDMKEYSKVITMGED